MKWGIAPGRGACGLSYRREPGFYLGSIYVNYGITVIVTGLLYGGLVLGAGWSHEAALAICLAAAVLVPILFFRHARGFLLALDGSVNAHQSGAAVMPGASDTDGTHLARLAADDGRAGCMMGVVLVLIVLFGILMAVVTLWFAGGLSSGPGPTAAGRIRGVNGRGTLPGAAESRPLGGRGGGETRARPGPSGTHAGR